MPQGLQLFDASGGLILDVTDRLTRILGVKTVTAAGSETIPALATGIPFVAYLFSTSFNMNLDGVPFEVEFVGTTMVWDRTNNDSPTLPSLETTFYYGVY